MANGDSPLAQAGQLPQAQDANPPVMLGQPPSAAKPQVGAGRHLVTGLASVLIDGLMAGMTTPTGPSGMQESAQKATQLPMQRQQQQINLGSQQLQFKAQLAQSHIQDLQTRILANGLDEQLQSGLSNAGWQFFQQALKNGSAKLVSGEATSREAAAAKLKELHDANPQTGLNYVMGPGMSKDSWGVWEIFPKNTMQDDVDFDIPGSEADGIPDEHVKIPAGTDMGTAKVLVSQRFRDLTAKLRAISDQKKTQTAAGARVQSAQIAADAKKATAAAGGAADKATDSSYNTQIKRLDTTRKPIEEMAARLNRLQNSLGMMTPQADAEIAPQLMVAMAGGQGSGVRITQAEINRTEGGRSGWEDLRARINHWQTDPSKALSITDSQRKQMRQLVKMVLDKVNTKLSIIGNTEQGLTNASDKKQHRQLMTDMHSQLESVDTGKFPDRDTANKVRDVQKNSGGDPLGIR